MKGCHSCSEGVRPCEEKPKKKTMAAEGGGGGETARAAEAPTQNVTPWEADAGDDGFDYDKLIREFGSTPISSEPVSPRAPGSRPNWRA